MRDLKSPKLMWIKAVLFLGIGGASALMVWLESPRVMTALLIILAIWAFCRAYYFGFYALEKYADPTFRYAGLISVARYVLRRNPRNPSP